MLSTAESTKQTSVTCVFFRCGAHGRGVPCAATCRSSRLPAVFPACMGAGASPAPPPAALGLRNRAHWPLPLAQPRPLKRSSIGACSSPPTPPMAVLLAARSVAVTMGGFCFFLGRHDALQMAETRLRRKANERREREGGKSEAEGHGHGRAVIICLHAGAARLAGGGNGLPLTSGHRRTTRPGRACPNRGRLQARACRLRQQRRQNPLPPSTLLSCTNPPDYRGPAPATHGKRSRES